MRALLKSLALLFVFSVTANLGYGQTLTLIDDFNDTVANVNSVPSNGVVPVRSLRDAGGNAAGATIVGQFNKYSIVPIVPGAGIPSSGTTGITALDKPGTYFFSTPPNQAYAFELRWDGNNDPDNQAAFDLGLTDLIGVNPDEVFFMFEGSADFDTDVEITLFNEDGSLAASNNLMITGGGPGAPFMPFMFPLSDFTAPPGFFDTPIGAISVVFNANSGTRDLDGNFDNFKFFTPENGVPEPSSMAILAMTLLGLGGSRYYRKRAQTAQA